MRSIACVLFFLMSFSLAAQKLSQDSEKLRSDQPEVYESIEKYAASKWPDDPERKIDEINGQTEAFSELCKMIIQDFSRKRFCLETIKKRTEDGKDMNFEEVAVNWKDVLLDERQNRFIDGSL